MITNYTKGFYLILMDSDSDVSLISSNFKSFVSVNLGIEKSIMVQKFFKRRNLKILKSSLSTGSEFPHFALTVVVELLKENEIIFWGTSGIGYDSITSMYLELYKICKDQEKIVFICHFKEANR
jgi:hypothetical protein